MTSSNVPNEAHWPLGLALITADVVSIKQQSIILVLECIKIALVDQAGLPSSVSSAIVEFAAESIRDGKYNGTIELARESRDSPRALRPLASFEGTDDHFGSLINIIHMLNETGDPVASMKNTRIRKQMAKKIII
jgi:hypothetical protein